MVKHVILWKLKEEFSAEEKQQSRNQRRTGRLSRTDSGHDRNQSQY
jgi:hypothetical protein